jgi:hypothetical protein
MSLICAPCDNLCDTFNNIPFSCAMGHIYELDLCSVR